MGITLAFIPWVYVVFLRFTWMVYYYINSFMTSYEFVMTYVVHVYAFSFLCLSFLAITFLYLFSVSTNSQQITQGTRQIIQYCTRQDLKQYSDEELNPHLLTRRS